MVGGEVQRSVTAPFVPGLELSRLFYEEAVGPIMERRFPGLAHGAARIENGSDVLGFDTPLSMDHGWGPRVVLFLGEDDYSEEQCEEIRGVLAAELPFEFRGFPTHFDPPGQCMVPTTQRPISHNVGVTTVRHFFRRELGVDPLGDSPLGVEEWLVLPEQQLRATTTGGVFRDDTGELDRARERLRWYPHDVWLYVLAAQWRRIGEEEAFMGRCGDVGDEIGSRIVAARLVREVMRLCFLMERQYPPYSKWFGTAFGRLGCAPRLSPSLEGALSGGTWEERERHLSAAYEAVAEMHNALGIIEPLQARVSPFHTRHYQVIHAGRFADALMEAISNEEVRRLSEAPFGVIGNTTQWAEPFDIDAPEWWQTLRGIYRAAIDTR